jgi:hypothetical protein
MIYYFLINQSSFDLLYADKGAAQLGMKQLVEMIIKVRSIFTRIGDHSRSCWRLVGHSQLAQTMLTPDYPLYTWAVEQHDEVVKKLFIILLMNGPFVDDDPLRSNCPEHRCSFQGVNYEYTSLAGACYYMMSDLKGILLSITRDGEFVHPILNILFSQDDHDLILYRVPNLSNQDYPGSLFWKEYRLSPRHQAGGPATLMDLENALAEKLLNMGIEEANHIFCFCPDNSTFYKFMKENEECVEFQAIYHGFPEHDLSRIPQNIQRVLLERAGRGYCDQ